MCGALSVLRFSSSAARFVTVQRISIGSTAAAVPALMPGEPAGPVAASEYLIGVKAAADPLGRAVALAARQQRVAVLFAAAYADPEDAEALQHAHKVCNSHCE